MKYTTIIKDRISGDYTELSFNATESLERFMYDFQE